MTGTLAVIAGKLSSQAIRTLGLGLGSNFPGRVSRKLSNHILSDLVGQARTGSIAVSGTNGKSTTSGLVASILEKSGKHIVHNRQGANLVAGITTAVVNAAGWSGKLDADYCLFEIDEAALPLVAREIDLKAVLVTNLFRDQLDRFGELDTTAKLISSGILEKQSLAVLNADDPNVAQMVPDCKRIFYGVESLSPDVASAGSMGDCGPCDVPRSGTSELSYCTVCGGEIVYSLIVYGQIGHYKCGSCGKERPSPTVTAANVKVTGEGSTFELRYMEHAIPVTLKLPGVFNVYNALGAAALCFSVGVSAQAVSAGLSEYTTLFGRSERLVIAGKSVLIQLIKNPAGASQAVHAAAADRNGRVMVAINDNYADGRDVSWLWDAEFEALAAMRGPFVVSGLRAYDMAVRLKYAGIDESAIIAEPSLETGLDRALSLPGEGETLWLLPTYTCLLDLQKILKSRGIHLAGT